MEVLTVLPNEIIEILQKYKSNNQQAFKNINNSIDEIIYNLNLFNESISSELQYLLSNHKTDDTNELYNDCVTLCEYIDSIEKSEEQSENCAERLSKEKVADKITSQISNNIPKPVKLFLCEDNVCPVCGCSMKETYISFTENNETSYEKIKIDTYRCDCCNRLFVCDYVINNIYLSRTNLIINYNYYNKIPSICIDSVIVLKSTLRCFSHRTETFLAQIPVLDEDGKIFYHSLDALYCFECNRFTILEDDFNAIKDIVLCKIVDETYVNNQENSNKFNIDKDCSVLKYYGYNVQTKKNISKQQRHIILSSLIESGIMTRRQVIDHIKVLIQRGSKIPSWSEATQKWKDDIDFVDTYKIEDLPKVVFDKIVLKYGKTSL